MTNLILWIKSKFGKETRKRTTPDLHILDFFRHTRDSKQMNEKNIKDIKNSMGKKEFELFLKNYEANYKPLTK